MIRVAVIFESSPFDRKGLFNAVHNRVKALLATGECWVDVFCIHARDNAFTRRVRHTASVPYVNHVDVDGITYRMLWYRFSILDHITLEKFGKRPVLFGDFMRRHVGMLQGYDVVVAHSFTGALFAYEASVRYDIPYFVTWHGSDVHTHPWRVPVIREDTAKVMNAACCNFFVSRALMAESERITSDARKDVLYNGVSEGFVRLDEVRRAEIRASYGIDDDAKVVAFVGNLVSVKNVLSLPDIFTAVSGGFDGKLQFVVAGDGKLRRQLEATCPAELNVSFLGNVPSGNMPSLMNCIDVLVLPSLNEGLPLVCAEALSCGADVVGSDVGGIPEVIGRENVAALGPDFVSQISQMIVTKLKKDQSDACSQGLSSEFSWARTAERELMYLARLQGQTVEN